MAVGPLLPPREELQAEEERGVRLLVQMRLHPQAVLGHLVEVEHPFLEGGHRGGVVGVVE